MEQDKARYEGRVDFRRAEALAGRLDALCKKAQEEGAKLPAGGKKAPATALQGELEALRREFASLWDMAPPPVHGLAVWDGVRRAEEEPSFCRALDVWNPRLMATYTPGEGEEPAPPAAPLLLWPKTGEENPLTEAAREAGIQVVEVLPPGSREGFSETVLSAEKALALYGGELVIFLCTGLSALPYADAFPNKLLWLALPMDAGELAGESYDRLYLRAGEVASWETAPGANAGEALAGARAMAALWEKRRAAGDDLLFLSSQNFNQMPGRPWHLARNAAQNGRRVLWLNAGATGEETRLVHREGSLFVFEMARGSGEGRLEPDGVLSAATPARQHRLQAEIDKILAAMKVRRALTQAEHPFWAEPAFALRREKRMPVLYDLHENFAEVPGAMKAELQRAEKGLLAGADFVTAASVALAQRAGVDASRLATVRSGCDHAHFSAAQNPEKPEGAPPVLGYYGPVTAALNFEVLRVLENSGLELEVHLVGPAAPEVKQKLAAFSKLRLREEASYEELPGVLAGFDLALLPYNTAQPGLAPESPGQFYEYLAAGKPVVGTAVPELMVFRGRYACLENDPSWFLRRVRECLDGISPLVDAEERARFAAQNDWKARAADFEEIFRKLEMARGRTIHGDVWAEREALRLKGAGEKPMLALPPPEKKRRTGAEIPRMQLAAARATLAEREEMLAKAGENTKQALALLAGRPEGGPNLLKQLGLGKSGGPTPLQKAEALLKENLALGETQARTAFLRAAGSEMPALSPVYTKYDLLFFPAAGPGQTQCRSARLAGCYAENGHRVFYFSPSLTGRPAVTKQRENFYLVELPGEGGTVLEQGLEDGGAWQQALEGLLWHFGIRDALAVVSHPRWLGAAVHLKESFGIHMVADCHSDFTGFLVPGSNEGEDEGMRLVRAAGAAIPASEAVAGLLRRLRDGESAEVVENGCDYPRFHAVFSPSKPCPPPVPDENGKLPEGSRRPVAGFCGYLSHWFWAGAVCEAARALPGVDFVLAGPLAEWETELRALPNIRLLGEVPYEEMPALVQGFDLALLPYDPGSEISETFTPAAFYEALAAGKKVVASRLPCLAPFEGKQALLAATAEEFTQHIKTVLAGEDGLAPAEEGAALAESCDWQARWKAFAAQAQKAVPGVSVVLCTRDAQELCQACLKAVLTQTALPGYELIVVDGGSGDGTRPLLEELAAQGLPGLRVLLPEGGKTYAEAGNLGLREAKGDYVVLLQESSLVTRGWLSALLARMEKEETLGLCGPATNLGGGEAKTPVYYRSADEMAEFAYFYTWQNRGQTKRKGKSLSLFCAMLRRKTLAEFGPLDETYQGARLPGHDLCLALQKAGLEVAVDEGAFVHRALNLPAEREDEAAQEAFLADKKHFEEKWDLLWKPRACRSGVNREMNLDSLFALEEPEEPGPGGETKGESAPPPEQAAGGQES